MDELNRVARITRKKHLWLLIVSVATVLLLVAYAFTVANSDQPLSPLSASQVAVTAANAMAASRSSPGSTPPIRDHQSALTSVSVVQGPTWSIVATPGAATPDSEGRLRFSIVLHNKSDVALNVGVSFNSYWPDGTFYRGCDGLCACRTSPGAVVNIGARESAIARCEGGPSPLDITGLTVRYVLWELLPPKKLSTDIQVSAVRLEKTRTNSDTLSYDATAVVTGIDDRETVASVLFRFYDETGTQVQTCESEQVLPTGDEPTAVHCISEILIDTRDQRPVRAKAELLTD